jgi:hypothetical protein
VVEAVARAGFGAIAPWRREIDGQDVAAVARHIRDAGLAVSGYCRSTYLPAADRAGFPRGRSPTTAGRSIRRRCWGRPAS